MENNQKALIIGGGLITVALLFANIYIGGVVAIIVATLYMGLAMMNTSAKFLDHPDVKGYLKKDAKGVILKNEGKADAKSIHISIVPLNIEFDVQTLKPEEKYEYEQDSMIEEAKILITYENEAGKTFSWDNVVSALAGEDDDDLLKPAFPMFAWKE
ncbi:MAG: hypothetical protein U9N40_02405 [Euryarchaeota archaeon]|nr:hypothetical protein [Euryarchaeota archaeon]